MSMILMVCIGMSFSSVTQAMWRSATNGRLAREVGRRGFFASSSSSSCSSGDSCRDFLKAACFIGAMPVGWCLLNHTDSLAAIRSSLDSQRNIFERHSTLLADQNKLLQALVEMQKKGDDNDRFHSRILGPDGCPTEDMGTSWCGTRP